MSKLLQFDGEGFQRSYKRSQGFSIIFISLPVDAAKMGRWIITLSFYLEMFVYTTEYTEC
jgi:hypothetical protein